MSAADINSRVFGIDEHIDQSGFVAASIAIFAGNKGSFHSRFAKGHQAIKNWDENFKPMPRQRLVYVGLNRFAMILGIAPASHDVQNYAFRHIQCFIKADRLSLRHCLKPL
ncbi:MAG: hypothetical protein P1U62_13410 [Alteraurantiacibacter sp. bin_em_oilr2.035]|uniref:Uncharacterized protein n=1 Tax=Croceicoccus marinus TaxID=450378 RepID=A0A217EYR9_9SPHN|nr:hypothetical protein [Aurantiacibacter atlanticus]ARU18273.1 hypothetical protein A9D14_18115 [Croceicoccus marinus]KZX53275.1 hypothetical protein A3711_15635 [Erythrobacter sp. HI00D59]KZX87083.1 hypothetical protein A3719_12820 [Erythrobacter sp. HI0020]KZY13211.1 hypothetical protein A3727_11010 [Erythrobacter sp. HI0038]KZY15619.1 hypothetical protein A3726_12825 [Erythrobacter sp. HI0037]MDF1835861.1 hypothetical protein [Alteraurantiacibacter sp. bin_em_oilr2.035]